MKALLDTNILIDYLNGVEDARMEVGRHRERYISLVTWMEVLAGAHNEEEEDVIEMFLRDFQVVEIPAYLPAEQGSHCFVRIRKRALTSPGAAARYLYRC